MLYYLLYQVLQRYFSPLNVFRYITVRTVYASLTAMFLAFVFGPWLIRKLRELQIGQFIREEGPQAHQKKAGTPTMGGVLIVLSTLVPTLLWADLTNGFVLLAIFSLLAFATIGFIDDYAKVSKQRNLGLTSKKKFSLQILISFVIGIGLLALATRSAYSTELVFPFLKRVHPDLVIHSLLSYPHLWPLAFVPFLIFVSIVIAGASNAVNLTDGLDGLAIGCTVIAAGALTILTYVSSNYRWATYLEIGYIPRVAELTIFCGALVGASRFSLVQRAPCRSVHGRRRVVIARRNAGRHRCGDQAGDPAFFRRRNLRDRSAIRDLAGRLVQVARQTNLPHGADPPSFRIDRLERVQGDRAFLDHRADLCAVCVNHAEIEVVTVRWS